MTSRYNRFGSRLRDVRERWGLTQAELAARSRVGIRTIRRIERAGDSPFHPRRETVERLAATLHVRAEWLLGDNGSMLSLAHMTEAEQFRSQTGPETEGLPGFVIVPGGVWFRGRYGEWRVSREPTQ